MIISFTLKSLPWVAKSLPWMFHKVKFGLQKAFCVVFEMSTSSKSVSSIQMGKRFDIRQGTAWYFIQKVRKGKKSYEK
jgi:hypothetical protein